MCACVEDTVAEECEHDEEDGEDHALVDPSLRLDPVIHHHVPILSCQDLPDTNTQPSTRQPTHIQIDEQTQTKHWTILSYIYIYTALYSILFFLLFLLSILSLVHLTITPLPPRPTYPPSTRHTLLFSVSQQPTPSVT